MKIDTIKTRGEAFNDSMIGSPQFLTSAFGDGMVCSLQFKKYVIDNFLVQ